jgi:hypothetical protein
MFLPDVHVWLALTFDSHIHHSTANTWFQGLSDQACFSPGSLNKDFCDLPPTQA